MDFAAKTRFRSSFFSQRKMKIKSLQQRLDSEDYIELNLAVRRADGEVEKPPFL